MKRFFVENLLICALVLLLLVSPCSAGPEGETQKEYLIKAAFLYNFAKFVEWPPCPTPPDKTEIVICIYGQDVFGGAMDSIRGKTVGDRAISIRYVSQPKEIDNCNILYVTASESERISEILEALKGRPILTISDAEGFAHLGGMIELLKVQSKIRFGINRKAAMASSIKISSHLLKLAQFVVE